jgi:hypothetical protein
MATWRRSYLLLGTPFGVACDHKHAADRLQLLLASLEAPLRVVPPGSEFVLKSASGAFELLRGGDRIYRSGAWPDLVTFMLTEMNRAALANYGGLACHAGVVAAGRRAIAFPAPSRGGKSTLTSACVLAGLEYVSDEALCIGFEDAFVAAYPRPIELSEWSREHLRIPVPEEVGHARDAFVGIGEIGGQVATDDLELAHLVLTEIVEGPPAIGRLPRSAVVTNLLRYSFNHYKRPSQSFELASRVAEACGAWRLTYDSATEAAELLRAKLAA